MTLACTNFSGPKPASARRLAGETLLMNASALGHVCPAQVVEWALAACLAASITVAWMLGA